MKHTAVKHTDPGDRWPGLESWIPYQLIQASGNLFNILARQFPQLQNENKISMCFTVLLSELS